MDSDEQKASEVLRAEISKRKLACYDGQLALSRLTPEQLTYTGHKSIEAGVLWYLESAQRDINKLIEAHVRKYPD